MEWNPLLVQILTFTAVTSLIMVVVVHFFGGDLRVDKRFHSLSDQEGESVARPGRKPKTQNLARRATSALPSMGAKLLPDDESVRTRLQSRLYQAGIYSSQALSNYFACKLAMMVAPPVLGIVCGLFGFVTLSTGMLWGVLFGGLGVITPTWWLNRRIGRRHNILRRSLPDFLDLMVACLESGLSMQGTIQRVSDELRIAHPLFASEMGIVQREIELGASVDKSLRDLADRTGLDGLRSLSTFVQQATRFGTAVSEALRVHAEMLRTQREQRAEEQAQKAAVKILFPTLIFIFPAVFLVAAGPAAIQLHEQFRSPAATASDKP